MAWKSRAVRKHRQFYHCDCLLLKARFSASPLYFMKFFILVCSLCLLYYMFFVVPSDYKKEQARLSQLTPRPTLQQVTAGHSMASLENLWAAIRQEQRQEDFAQVRNDIDLLVSHYPESEQAQTMAPLASHYDSLAQVAQQRELSKNQRRHQPDYYKDYPMDSYRYWAIKHRTNEFKDTLPALYLTTTRFRFFYGNATSYGYNSPLRARIEVDSSRAIAFTLFKKSSSSLVYDHGKPTYQADALFPSQGSYTVAIRTDDGRTCQLAALANQNRLQLNEPDSYKLHQLLQHGGELRFVFTQADNAATSYGFSIDNADDYEVYCHELMARIGQQRVPATTR
jgi:hypothetical protein